MTTITPLKSQMTGSPGLIDSPISEDKPNVGVSVCSPPQLASLHSHNSCNPLSEHRGLACRKHRTPQAFVSERVRYNTMKYTNPDRAVTIYAAHAIFISAILLKSVGGDGNDDIDSHIGSSETLICATA